MLLLLITERKQVGLFFFFFFKAMGVLLPFLCPNNKLIAVSAPLVL